jgi:amino acid transporter
VGSHTVWNVTALLFWAFLGWENLSFSLGEMKDPERMFPAFTGLFLLL